MVRLSLCMIVKNEAHRLKRCLDSVGDLVDEAIVVDTGSRDGTPSVAKAWGAQVHRQPWPGDFALARNQALTHVQGDWVLVLDGDEVFVPEQIQPLRSCLTQPDLLVINLLRREVGAVQSPYSLVSRVFRRHPAVQFSRPYHALIDDSVEALRQREPQWRVMTLGGVALLHEGYTPGAIAGGDKAEKARQAMESHLAAHPQDPYTCAKLGALYGSLGQWHQGAELLDRGLRVAAIAPVDPTVAYELHYHRGIAAKRLGDGDGAITHYQAALALPLLPLIKVGACHNLGVAYHDRRDWDAAHHYYSQALAWDPQFALGYYHLGLLHQDQKQWPAAIAAYHQALTWDPHHAPTHQNLGVVWLRLGRLGDATAALNQAIALHRSQGRGAEADLLAQTLAEWGA
jgi:glycosyltransferase involved in cell wall biosynthesis